MIIDNTAGLQFLLSDDIYLLRSDMDKLNVVAPPPVAPEVEQPILASGTVAQYIAEPVIAPEPVIETPAVNFTFTGSNQQHFLILCNYPGMEAMDEKHLEALTGALKRKGLDLDDVAILNKANHPEATIADLTGYFKPERLLILGKTSLIVGWDKFIPNQLENLNGMKALYTFNFAQMLGDRERTKTFWEQMKAL